MKLKMSLLPGEFAVCRLAPEGSIDWAKGEFFSITKTRDELSVVCLQSLVPADVKHESNWSILKIEGPLDFSLIGILSKISSVLAEKEISIFAISTFDTDYILVKSDKLTEAKDALKEVGIIF